MQTQDIVGYRLSPQQRRLWKLRESGRLAAGSVVGEFKVSGKVDRDRLVYAIRNAVEECELLRTSFAHLSGMLVPLQVVGDVPAIVLQEVNPGNGPTSSAWDEIKSQAAGSAVDYENSCAPKFWFSREKDGFRLLISVPSICADRVSMVNVGKAISRFYAGQEIARENAPLQYADLSKWLNELVESEESSEGRSYWEKQLSGKQSIELRLPGENSAEIHDVRQTTKRGLRELAMAVAVFAERIGVNETAVLLACWQTLLWRLSSVDELSLNVVLAGRSYDGTGEIIGPLERAIPIFTELTPQTNVFEFVKAADRQYREAADWQEYYDPELLSVESAHAQFGFAHSEHEPEWQAGGTRWSVAEILDATLAYKAFLKAVKKDSELQISLQYDAAQINEAMAERVLRQYMSLLTSVVKSGPTSRITELNLADAEECLQLQKFNETACAFPLHKTVIDLFLEQARQSGTKTAVSFNGTTLSYAELDRRSSKLALRLTQAGIGEGQIVGICLKRSVDLVVAMLGTWKAGAAYFPFEEDVPASRLAYMLGNSGVNLILTETESAKKLRAHGRQLITLDSDAQNVALTDENQLATLPSADSVAYIIYTSGSTGEPKGVMVTHRNLANHMFWVVKEYGLGERERVLLKTSISFDACVWEWLFPLLQGGTLVVAADGMQSDSRYLAEILKKGKITTLQVVPTMLRVLLEEDGITKCSALERIFAGGEALTPDVVKRFQERVGKTLINMYGPTEATINATCLTMGSETSTVIGRPIANTQIYILREDLGLCGIGEAGEICIAGEAVARGYIGRPEETAAKYVANPYSSSPGARMYRSGDKGRWNGEGELEFVGRMDNQVKVRGYRIELGEVERAVQEQGGVAQAAVVVKERVGGERQLIAYVEMAEGSSGDAVGRVRAGVRERLPEYMCPAQYVRMERIPRTASGKLDRKALPEPEVAGERGQEYVAPRNEVERRLLEIWETVLGSQGIGVKDNFFEVGGDSIVGIQIVARARQAGLELTPKQLFQYQSIAELAEQAGRGSEVVEAEQGEVRGAGPLTPIQRWFMEQHGVKARHYNQAFLFRVKAETRLEWLEEALEKLVEQHDSLRMRVEQNEGEWEQSYAGVVESGVRVKRVDLSGSKGAEQEEQLREVVRREQESLDIERGPVAGIVLVELGEEKGRRLLMVVHHMAVDGVSWRIMLEDVANWYGQRERGEQISGGRKTTSFKQWAEKLQEYGKSEKAEAERTYWAGEEARAVEELAVDYESGENRFGDEGRVVEVLEAETTRELLSEAGKAYNTQVMDLLLGALVEGLWEWGGYERVRVELEGHGREDVVKGVDLTRTVGWFTSLYPVVLERRVGESVGARIQRVKEQLREVPEKGIGYGVLRYGRSQSQQPAAAITKTAAETVAAVEKRKGEGELLINYLGQFDRSLGEEALLQGAREGSGAPVGAEQQRSAKVEMNALVIGGQLQMAWSYSRQQYKPETIAKLAQDYLLTLREIIRHCISSDARTFSANDFSEFKWESEQFGAIATAISQAG